MSVRTRRTRSGIRTAIAIVLLAFMLFPVYWMLNISLQATGGTLATSFFPTHPASTATGQRSRIRAATWSPA
jgi:multiple sugar transport system permease protein